MAPVTKVLVVSGAGHALAELDITELLAAGEPDAAIAHRLALAEKTVRNRVSQIYLKLRVSNRTEAIVHWLSRTGSR
nr:hypothetical protein GCM10020063_082070 [Dactylosporangium thailandense]